MKLIVIRNNFDKNSLNKKGVIFNTLPDTCFLNNGKPFFIPEFADPCHIEGHLAIRICRLGRSISERFAHRYYDAVTVGATFIAENLLTQSQEKGLPWDLATNFDNAAPIGTFIPLYDKQTSDPECTKQFKPLADDICFKLTINNKPLFTATSGQMNHHIDKIIALISQYYTLRQGDIIYTGSPIPSQIVNINDKIEGYLNDELVLKFNVK